MVERASHFVWKLGAPDSNEEWTVDGIYETRSERERTILHEVWRADHCSIDSSPPKRARTHPVSIQNIEKIAKANRVTETDR